MIPNIGKKIAKLITPPSESASEEDSDPEEAQKDKDMQKNLALTAKYFKKLYKPTNNNLRTSSNSRNKNNLYYTQDILFQEAMDSQSTQTIKLPILQPGEYDLWKMRMEQYLQCIDYTLWEIVENGNAPIVTKTVDGKESVIPPTRVEEKAQRRAELKGRVTF
ncbi:hypothetical protein Tco_0621015 [Tanacetum coccineum]